MARYVTSADRIRPSSRTVPLRDNATEARGTAQKYRFRHAVPVIQKNSLAQLHTIDAGYASAIYDILPTHTGYTLEDIAEGARTTHLVGKSPQFFAAGEGASFMGMPVGRTQ
ncbi:hypothetical protein FRC10_011540, partial [Ceratobasidium sp. 414]